MPNEINLDDIFEGYPDESTIEATPASELEEDSQSKEPTAGCMWGSFRCKSTGGYCYLQNAEHHWWAFGDMWKACEPHDSKEDDEIASMMADLHIPRWFTDEEAAQIYADKAEDDARRYCEGIHNAMMGPCEHYCFEVGKLVDIGKDKSTWG